MNLKLPLTLIDFVICTTKCRVKQDLVHVSQEILVKGTQDAIIDLAALLAKVCMHLYHYAFESFFHEYAIQYPKLFCALTCLPVFHVSRELNLSQNSSKSQMFTQPRW